jgi:hypothetical protein
MLPFKRRELKRPANCLLDPQVNRNAFRFQKQYENSRADGHDLVCVHSLNAICAKNSREYSSTMAVEPRKCYMHTSFLGPWPCLTVRNEGGDATDVTEGLIMLCR